MILLSKINKNYSLENCYETTWTDDQTSTISSNLFKKMITLGAMIKNH